ncbi:MAG: hypothetical protein MRY32_00635 [Rickettsiales bacterium]|nr:hypothetical protein [Rickettsiales bacterium]
MASSDTSVSPMVHDYRRMRALMSTMIFLQNHPKRTELLRLFCDKTLPKMQTDVGRLFIQNYLENLPPSP